MKLTIDDLQTEYTLNLTFAKKDLCDVVKISVIYDLIFDALNELKYQYCPSACFLEQPLLAPPKKDESE